VAEHQADSIRPLTRLRALQWLDQRSNFERTPVGSVRSGGFTLTRMRRLLRAVGDPQQQFRAAHLAGTKGKGSTATMLASMVRAAGYRVGCYLSPHVDRLEERIAVGGRPIPSADLLAAFQQVMPAVERLDRLAARRNQPGPTWFEVLTAVAFTHFARSRVDLAVIETGLGGRLDATNLCQPVVSVITCIGLDHMDVLGDTIEKIATEKAGIIRRGCPVISVATDPAAAAVVARTAGRLQAPLQLLGRDFQVSKAAARSDPRGTAFTLECPPGHDGGGYTAAMPGWHQAINAAAAIMAVRALPAADFTIPERASRRGLRQARLPARIEWLSEHPPVLLDAAHNTSSMAALVETLAATQRLPRRRILVFAASGDKQIAEMLREARRLFTAVVLTRYATNPRAATLTDLRQAALQAGWQDPLSASSPAEAVELARKLAAGRGLICVAGSFFLAAEARAALAAAGPGTNRR
jgi:dihydrofolate synthase/folylpolyglutamate synthase